MGEERNEKKWEQEYKETSIDSFVVYAICDVTIQGDYNVSLFAVANRVKKFTKKCTWLQAWNKEKGNFLPMT